MRTNFTDVGSFHHKFDLDHVSCSQLPGCRGAYERTVPRELLEFRLKFLLEELREIGEAADYALMATDAGRIDFVRMHHREERPIDHPKLFDGLLDLAYVTFGMAHIFGYPWQVGWDEVQRANITKERATRAEDSTRGSTYDVIKPAGWKAPGITGILRALGFTCPESE